jgi:8-oxo-dGTP pyrophosphatase MutT (NUDIX family)
MENFSFQHKGKEYWYSRSIAVLGIVVKNDLHGKRYILANKRGKNTPDYQGLWNMPCGYLDFDETVEEAVSREVWEETGVKINPDRFELIHINSIPNRKQNVTLRYRVFVYGEENYILSNENSEQGEVDDVKWILIDDIEKYDWAFNHLELINQYCK